jgi:hypothetical protein
MSLLLIFPVKKRVIPAPHGKTSGLIRKKSKRTPMPLLKFLWEGIVCEGNVKGASFRLDVVFFPLALGQEKSLLVCAAVKNTALLWMQVRKKCLGGLGLYGLHMKGILLLAEKLIFTF